MATKVSGRTEPLSPILHVFKEQLESECEAIGTQQNLGQRGHKLIWWYFVSLEQFNPADVLDVFCDGAADLGIDSVWIDEDEVVHFYSFKHPEDPNKGFPASEVDKVISGLGLIIQRGYDNVANAEVCAKLDQVFETIPSAYRLHLVTSGGDLNQEATAKLAAFVRAQGMSAEYFTWECEHLAKLQARFYQKSLPRIGSPIVFVLPDPPYTVKSGDAVAYFFHSTGKELAGLFGMYGETLLQRNIRVDQGESATNLAIQATCRGDHSPNFLHFNNGLSFLCDEANWDNIKKELRLSNAQVVNGGQTIRALFKAGGSLKPDVLVPLRAITSSGNKSFANDVTVNQNNQNTMKTGFLRSNDVQVIQLANAMASKGWFLERRKDELKYLTQDEKRVIEQRIKNTLADHAIPLTKGSQAYVATYRMDPELAKKNAAKMFKSCENGGQFEEIFDQQLTADKMITAHQILSHVERFVQDFVKLKKRRAKATEERVWESEYRSLLGNELINEHLKELDQAIPQSAMMLAALVFRRWQDGGKDPQELPAELKKRGAAMLREELLLAFQYVADNPKAMDKSWPNILKSNTFYKKLAGDDNGKAQPKKRRKSRSASHN